MLYPIKIEFKDYPSGIWQDWSTYLLEPPVISKKVESENEGEAGAIVFDSANVKLKYASGSPVYSAFSIDLSVKQRYVFRISAVKTDKTYVQLFEGIADFSTLKWPDYSKSVSFDLVDKLSALNILQNRPVRTLRSIKDSTSNHLPWIVPLDYANGDYYIINVGVNPTVVIEVIKYLHPAFTPQHINVGSSIPVISAGMILKREKTDDNRYLFARSQFFYVGNYPGENDTWLESTTDSDAINGSYRIDSSDADAYLVTDPTVKLKYYNDIFYTGDICNTMYYLDPDDGNWKTEVTSFKGEKMLRLLVLEAWPDISVTYRGFTTFNIPYSYWRQTMDENPFNKTPLDALIMLANTMKSYVFIDKTGNCIVQTKADLATGGTTRTIGSTKIISGPEKSYFWDKLVDGIIVNVQSWVVDAVTGENLVGTSEMTKQPAGFTATEKIKPKNEITKDILAGSDATDTQAELDTLAAQEALAFLNFYGQRHSAYDLVLNLDDNTINWELIDLLTIGSDDTFYVSLEFDLVERTVTLEPVEITGHDYDLRSVVVGLSENAGTSSSFSSSSSSGGGGGTSYVFDIPLVVSGGIVSLAKTGNLKITSNQLDTIQNIRTTDSPTFAGLTLTGDLSVGTTSGGKNLVVVATESSELAPPMTGNSGTNWTASYAGDFVQPFNGTLQKNGTVNGSLYITPTGSGATPTIGVTYKIVITIASSNGPAMFWTFGGIVLSYYIYALGTYTYYVTAISTAKFVIGFYQAILCTISNISIIAYTVGTGDLTIGGNLTVRTPASFSSSIIAGGLITSGGLVTGTQLKSNGGYGTILSGNNGVLIVNNAIGNGGLGLYSTNSNPVVLFPNGIAKLYALASGRVGISTSAPDKGLEINEPTGQCLRLTYNDSNGSAANYVDFLVSSSGDLTITPSGTNIFLNKVVTLAVQATTTSHAVRADRNIATSYPLTGGGNLTADRTIGLGYNTDAFQLTGNALDIRITNKGFATANLKVMVTSGGGLETIQDIFSTASPTWATVKLTNLTDGYLPYHIADATGLGNSPIYTNGTNIGLGTTTLTELFNLDGNFKHNGNYSLYNNFTSGWTGSGWKLDYGVTTSSFSSLQLDNLWLRGSLTVYELIINQIRATNGSLFVSSAARVKSTSAGTTGDIAITFEDPTGHNLLPFAIGDILIMQRVNLSGSTVVKKIALRVMDITTITAECNYLYQAPALAAPAAGDDLVRIGSYSDVNRQGSIYLTADDVAAPYIDIIDGITQWIDWGSSTKTKVRIGKLNGITDSFFGALTGYGLFAKDDVYLKGKIYAQAGGWIAGWNINAASLSSPIVTDSIYDYQMYLMADDVNNRIGTYLHLDINTVGIPAYLSFGKIKDGNGGYQTNYGLAYKQGSSSFFELSNTTKQIAGWNFDSSKLYHGGVFGSASAGIELNAASNYINLNKDATNYIKLYYTSNTDWGIKGANAGNNIFQLGYINQIAGWTFDVVKLTKGSATTGISLNTSSTAFITGASAKGFEIYDYASPKLFLGKKDGNFLDWNITSANGLTIKGKLVASEFSTNVLLGDDPFSIVQTCAAIGGGGSAPYIFGRKYTDANNDCYVNIKPDMTNGALISAAIKSGTNSYVNIDFGADNKLRVDINGYYAMRWRGNLTDPPLTDLRDGDTFCLTTTNKIWMYGNGAWIIS